MDKAKLKKLIDTASGRIPADLCIKNARVVDVFNKSVFQGDVYIAEGLFAGFGAEGFPKALKEIDARLAYMAPGFIDSHVHIESSHLCPSEFSRLVVPCGTTTVIADPHEICNVCGVDGLDYMLSASEGIALSVFLMFPSCVPATPFENAGAVLLAKDIETRINNPRVLGLGELMNFFGVAAADSDILDKLLVAYKAGKIIDGHSPGIEGSFLDAYSASGVRTDHECDTPKELEDRIRRGMYVLLRQGSACHNVASLLKGVNARNAERCLYCTDDRQPKSIIEEGHIDNNIRISIKEGLDPITAIAIATINSASCFGLKDRGAIAPGLRADFVLIDDLESFHVAEVFTEGHHVASNGKYLAFTPHFPTHNVSGMMNVKGFSIDRLALKLKGPEVRTIDIIPGSVVTNEGRAKVCLDESGIWRRGEDDIIKLAVIERHHGTGNIGLALLRGYGLRNGAVALSIAHDSHNIIVAGDNDNDMEKAVKALIELGGGIVLVKEGRILDSLAHEIAGLMTDQSGDAVSAKLAHMHALAQSELGIHKDVDPVMTLCFMALPVIPALKLTDLGLFDVTKFAFTTIEA